MNTKSNGEYISKAIIIIFSILITACATLNRSGLQPVQAQIRNPGSIAVPTEFKTVWYRAGKKGISLLAFSASGKLTISEHSIEFGEGNDALKININDIHSISWGKMSVDFYNDWAIIKYGSPEKVAGFMDGSNIGLGGDTDLIYSTLKYSVEVLGGHKPTIEPPFASGWIDVSLGGLTIFPKSKELALNIWLNNKFGNNIWVKVEFLNPDLSSACEVVIMIPSENNGIFSCRQAPVLSDQNYPIYMYVFLDKDLSELVEKTGTSMRFSQQVIKNIK